MNKRNPLFRPTHSKNRYWNLVKTILQICFFWVVFLYLLPFGVMKMENIFGLHNFEPLQRIGWLLLTVFSLLGLWSGYTMSWIGKGTPLPMDCSNELVIKGPYRWVRNPMAVAGIGQGMSVGIITGSYFVIAYALVGAFFWHLLVRPSEEADLENRFGSSYIEYKKKTRCWIPK